MLFRSRPPHSAYEIATLEKKVGYPEREGYTHKSLCRPEKARTDLILYIMQKHFHDGVTCKVRILKVVSNRVHVALYTCWYIHIYWNGPESRGREPFVHLYIFDDHLIYIV